MKEKRSTRKWRKFIIIGVIVGLVLLYGVYPWLAAYQIVHPKRDLLTTTPAAFGLKYEEVVFSSSDAIFLSGWYVPSKNGAAIVLSHGATRNREQMLSHAAFLAENGYGVLLYDARSHGNSQGEVTARGWLEGRDVEGAVKFLQARDDVKPDQIGVLGYSMGGEAALRAAAKTDAIRALVVDMPTDMVQSDPINTFGEWLLYPTRFVLLRAMQYFIGGEPALPLQDLVSEISSRPLLVISNDAQPQQDVWATFMAASEPKTFWQLTPPGTLFEAFPTSRPFANLWKVYSPEFAGGIEMDPDQYTKRVTDFFNEALLGQ